MGRWSGQMFLPFFLLLLGAMICVSAIPQPDLPETSYNEVDTPVNQAPPVVPGIRLPRPTVATTILPRQGGEGKHTFTPEAREWKSANTPVPRDPHALLDLLCTLLI